MKRVVLATIFVVIVVCGCLLLGHKFLTIRQLRSVRVLGWEGDRYLWGAGTGGGMRWDVNQQVVVNRSFRLDGVNHFFTSSEDQIWAYGDGIWLFESGNWIEMGKNEGLQRGRIYDMVQTNDGAIWIATSRGFKSWNEEDRLWESTLINQPGRTLVQDSDHGLWFGLAEDGVLRLQFGELTHWTVNDGLIDNKITSLLAASDGSIWVGTRRGVSYWDGNKWEGWEDLGYPDPDGLVVHKLYETSDGTIWAATSEDMARWDGREWTSYHRSPPCFTIFTLLEANDGTLWIGCTNGLFRWSGQDWREYTSTEGLNDNSLGYLVKGANGTLYVSTRGGVYQYSTELDRWQPFPDK